MTLTSWVLAARLEREVAGIDCLVDPQPVAGPGCVAGDKRAGQQSGGLDLSRKVLHWPQVTTGSSDRQYVEASWPNENDNFRNRRAPVPDF